MEHETAAPEFGRTEQDTGSDTAELADELLIEEISIDGMCGVY